jgi:hypothetical protein
VWPRQLEFRCSATSTVPTKVKCLFDAGPLVAPMWFIFPATRHLPPQAPASFSKPYVVGNKLTTVGAWQALTSSYEDRPQFCRFAKFGQQASLPLF